LSGKFVEKETVFYEAKWGKYESENEASIGCLEEVDLSDDN
jgi:hypothetical protein